MPARVVIEDEIARIAELADRAAHREIRQLLGGRSSPSELASRVNDRDQAGLHRLAAPDLDLDAADPDRLGPEQARAERPLVRQFPAAPERAARAGRQGRPVRRRVGIGRLHLLPPTSSWGSAKGRSAASATSGKDQSIYHALELGLGALRRHDAANDLALSRGASTPTRRSPIRAPPMSAAASYHLGDTAAIGNHNFEVFGVLAGTGVNGIDADPAQVIYDFLTNAQYGCGFNAA